MIPHKCADNHSKRDTKCMVHRDIVGVFTIFRERASFHEPMVRARFAAKCDKRQLRGRTEYPSGLSSCGRAVELVVQ